MPYQSQAEANDRLADPAPLTDQELLDLLPWMRAMAGGSLQRLHTEVAIKNVTAIRDFERSSNRVARWMIVLVIGQVVLAAAQVALFLGSRRKDAQRAAGLEM